MRKNNIDDVLDAQMAICQAEAAFGKIRNFDYLEEFQYPDIALTLMVTTDFDKISCLLDNALMFLLEYYKRLKELTEKGYYDSRAEAFLGECSKITQSMRNRATEMHNAHSVEEVKEMIPEVKVFKNLEKVLSFLRMVFEVEDKYRRGGKLDDGFATQVYEFHYK